MSSPACCSPEKVWKIRVCKRSAAMKAPVGLLSDGAVLRSKMEGLCPDKFRHDAQNADNARKNTAFPPVCKKCAKVCRAPENGKSHDESYDSSWDFGALEGTRIPGPLIKSQMLYRLSYERIHYKAQYNTILPNNITILPGKKQAFCTKNFPKAVIGQILPRTAPLQTGQEPVQSKQFITKLQPTCRAHFRAGQADPIGGLFP